MLVVTTKLSEEGAEKSSSKQLKRVLAPCHTSIERNGSKSLFGPRLRSGFGGRDLDNPESATLYETASAVLCDAWYKNYCLLFSHR